MNSDELLREQLVVVLHGGETHMTFEEAVKDFPEEAINNVFPHGEYSTWGLLEHLRLTQRDILDFSINPKYKEPKWPDDYWPKKGEKATKAMWDTSVKNFIKDLKELEKLAEDPKTDLYAKIPWGTGQTILREILHVADHNAYHIGELAIMRQTMNTWKK